MKVSLINIGDELLIGQVINTNATKMSQLLIAAGMDVQEIITIADEGNAIEHTLKHCLTQSDAVLLTGGLGPTKDDITKNTLCHFFHSHLVENKEALANVTRIFKARGYELTEINRRQSWVPECCTMINNILGTAPCMWFEVPPAGNEVQQVVISLPGVPFEMQNLMENEVVPRLKKHFHTNVILNKNILVQGIGESFLSDMIEQWELTLPSSIRLAYLPQSGMVKLRLTARGTNKQELQKQLDHAVTTLYPLTKQYIVGEDFETLPELVAHTFTSKGITLATAESCTGGKIASQLTSLAGASKYFRGSIVAYSNEVKEHTLGVQHTTLQAHGAVSKETVLEMATGALQGLKADYAIATTGIAGPTGGTPQKPVGTVWIGVVSPTEVVAKQMNFGDDRLRTIERTCNEAYSMLIKMINK